MAIQSGTEYQGVVEIVPGAKSIPNKPAKGRANAGSGSKTTTPAPGRVSIVLRPMVGDTMTKVAGATAVPRDLSTLNANFQGQAWSFPAASGDDNKEEWVSFAIPIELANVPKLRARVSLIIE